MSNAKWIIIKVVTKCPRCGREYVEIGKDAEGAFSASNITCATCGFTGEMLD
ncbi:MAG: hypothetical protein M0Q91_14725 [Methanoregula sp.]|nr:hypothetical protein [Methanoregula sp.]